MGISFPYQGANATLWVAATNYMVISEGCRLKPYLSNDFDIQWQEKGKNRTGRLTMMNAGQIGIVSRRRIT